MWVKALHSSALQLRRKKKKKKTQQAVSKQVFGTRRTFLRPELNNRKALRVMCLSVCVSVCVHEKHRTSFVLAR